MGLPVEFLYLVLLLVVIVVLFVFLKRPIYEAMLIPGLSFGFDGLCFGNKQEKICLTIYRNPSLNSYFMRIVGPSYLAYIFSAHQKQLDYVLGPFIVRNSWGRPLEGRRLVGSL